MRLSIEEDVSAEPGHARLRLEGVAPAADMRFRLSRKAQEPPNLGRDGWQAEPALLEPLEVRAEGGDTVLLVGPEVVDRIPFNTRVEIEVPALGGRFQEWWPDIAPSPGGPGSGRLGASRPARPEPAAPLPPAAPVPPVPLGPSVPPAVPAAPAPPPEPPYAEPPPDPGPTPPVVPDPTPEPHSRLWLILLALILLVAAGSAAYWYLGPEPQPQLDGQTEPLPEPEPQPQPEPEPEPEPQPQPEPEPEPEPEPQPAQSACAAGAAARLTAENATAAQWLEAAAACRSEGGGEALVEVLDACMGAGHAGCLLEMGRCYDPRYEASAACGIALYPEIAADYYSRAAEAGAEGAAAELESLCGHLNETSPEQAVLAGC
jgi:hypothetical protein